MMVIAIFREVIAAGAVAVVTDLFDTNAIDSTSHC